MTKYIIPCLLFITLCMSCAKDFDTMNVDPTQFIEATPEAAMQGAFKRLNDFMANNNTNRWWDIAHTVNTGSRYNVEDGGLWQVMYVNVLEPINQLKRTYGDNATYTNRIQVARIWECYAYYILVANYGPVPRSQANNRDYLANIKYDSEDSVYSYIMNTLKDAASKIDVNNTSDRLTYDAIYGNGNGSLLSWKKFANTLRLKVALNCYKNLQQEAAAHITDVMSNEANTISSEAETAKQSYENLINNENPYFIKYKRMSYTLDPPVLMDILFVYFRSYKDPRLDAYYDSVPAVTDRYLLRDTLTSTADDSLRVVDYRIPHFGKPKSPAKLPGWSGLVGNDPLGGANVRTYSRMKGYGWVSGNNQSAGAGLIAPDRPFIILSYAEAQFLKAEAAYLGLGGSKSAEQYYYEGIDANFAYWKIGNTQRDAFKERDGIKWNTQGNGFTDYVSVIKADIPADNLEKIYIQQWINYYPDQAFDIWTLQRRTRAMHFPPHTNPNNGVVPTPYIDIPLRGNYPFASQQINPVGYNDALSQLGAIGNDLNPYIPLKFTKAYDVPDWNAIPAMYSTAYMQKWYGATIQHLQAAGIPYTLILTYK
jgi:hypothetical protein